MRKMSMKNSAKKFLALGLAATMVVPATFAAGNKTASAETLPTAVRVIDLENGFEKKGVGLDVADVGDLIQFKEYLDAKGQKPINEKTGEFLGTYETTDTVYLSGQWASGKGYQTEAIPSGAAKQKVPDFKTDTGEFFTSATPNQPTTMYDDEKGNVFWLDNTYINDSYPSYATTVDWENGTYKTDMDKIIKDTTGYYMEFGINNSAAEIVDNPLADLTGNGFTIGTWVKNTTPYVAPVKPGKLGDVNGDTAVDANDALDILKYVAKMITFEENVLPYAKVNADDAVDANDALDILKFVAKMITEFTGKEPEAAGGEVEVKFLDNSELFSFEKRVEVPEGTTPVQSYVLDRVHSRGYLYFTANSVVFVPDFDDASKTVTWTLAEDLQGDEADLLNSVNGGEWNYLSYSFDGKDFHMYVNGQERALTKEISEGYAADAAGSDVVSFVKSSEAYLGGYGGGMRDNFNTFRMDTSDDYYLDDIAYYAQSMDEATATSVYTAANDKKTAEANRTVNKLKEYKLDGTTLAANELTAVSDGCQDAEYLPIITTDATRGNVLQTVVSTQGNHGGVKFASNPFAGQDDLTGVTISYWMKAKSNKRGVVTDGVLFSFIDGEHECWQEKVGDAYLGNNGIARSQLYFNVGYWGAWCEGQTKAVGANSLKNIYTYKPYTYGDPTVLEERMQKFGVESYNTYKTFLRSLDNDWVFVTITINNSGMNMYINGEQTYTYESELDTKDLNGNVTIKKGSKVTASVANQYVDAAGPRFFDGCWDRVGDAFKNGTNNPGARTLMDFITAEDTELYLGYVFGQSSNSSFEKTAECYLSDVSLFDADMTADEVRTLYKAESAK